MRLVKSRSRYLGPIPPPGALAQYEETLPGAADRILKMTENQQAHRRALETRVVESGARESIAGIAVGGIVSVAALVVAAIFVTQGQPWFGIAAVLGTIGSLAGVFVYGGRSQREERTTRLQETLNPTVDVTEPPKEQPSDPQLPRE